MGQVVVSRGGAEKKIGAGLKTPACVCHTDTLTCMDMDTLTRMDRVADMYALPCYGLDSTRCRSTSSTAGTVTAGTP